MKARQIKVKTTTQEKGKTPTRGGSMLLSSGKVIQPLFLSLSKNQYGNLGHAAARYVLHRAFVRQHGWSMKGLEPRNISGSSDELKEWVPEYLLNAIEQLVGTNG